MERESWHECQPAPFCILLVFFPAISAFFRQFPPLFWQFPALFVRCNFSSNWPHIALLECSAADVLTQFVEQSWFFHKAATEACSQSNEEATSNASTVSKHEPLRGLSPHISEKCPRSKKTGAQSKFKEISEKAKHNCTFKTLQGVFSCFLHKGCTQGNEKTCFRESWRSRGMANGPGFLAEASLHGHLARPARTNPPTDRRHHILDITF